MSSTQEVGEIFGAGSGPAHAMLRSPTVLIAAVGLWGMNIYFFRLFGIDYAKVLNHDLLKLAAQKEQQLIGDHSKRNIGSKSRPARIRSRESSDLGESISSCELSELELFDDPELTIMDTSDRDNNNIALHDEITAARLVGLSLTMLIMLHSTYSIWIDWLGGGSIGAIFAFYGAVTAAILFPLQSTRWLRHATGIVLYRALELVNPRCHCLQLSHPTATTPGASAGENNVASPKTPRPIPFVDVFFADAMCSFSKVFFDWGMLLHMAAYYPKPVRQSAYNILVPSAFAAVPYLIRAQQCLVMWTVTKLKNDPHRFQHLWNALKYSTSIFPLCLSAYQKTIPKERAENFEIILIVLLMINASYSLFWDVVMDWGMMKNPSAAASFICYPTPSGMNGMHSNNGFLAVPPRDQPTRAGATPMSSHPNTHVSCWYALLRNRLRFGVAVSVLILVTDAVLRFSWALRFYHNLFPSADSFVLCTQFLEVFRRSIWNLLRVEWENLKQSGHHVSGAHNKPSSPAPMQLTMLPLTTPNNPNTASDNDEKTSFLVQRGGMGSKVPHHTSKITNEKNAEA